MPLFGRFGFRKTTIDEIAQAAGLGKGTIYLYFKSKDEIFSAGVRREVRAFYADLNAKLAMEQDVIGKLRTFIVQRVQHLQGLRVQQKLSADAVYDTKTAPELAPLRKELSQPHVETLGKIVREGCAKGVFSIADPDMALSFISAVMVGIFDPLCQLDCEFPLVEKADILIEFIVNGLQGPRGVTHDRSRS